MFLSALSSFFETTYGRSSGLLPPQRLPFEPPTVGADDHIGPFSLPPCSDLSSPTALTHRAPVFLSVIPRERSESRDLSGFVLSQRRRSFDSLWSLRMTARMEIGTHTVGTYTPDSPYRRRAVLCTVILSARSAAEGAVLPLQVFEYAL